MSERYGGERVRRGLLHFVLGKGVSALSGFVAMVLVVRILPVEVFADYSVLIALVEFVTALSGLGLAHAMLRYVPQLYVLNYRTALRQFVWGAFLLRSVVLVAVALLAWVLASPISPLIGLHGAADAFRLFLAVVVVRCSNHFLSQVLDSTLHQGAAQIAYSINSVSRLIGMVYLSMSGDADLLSVIWVELISDLLGFIAILIAIVKYSLSIELTLKAPDDDQDWVRKNLRQIARFCLSGYVQHIVGLPFGGNTNRLVGGHLFSDAVMASYGFAQSLYEFIKRYLPAQLLIGLIRPVVVARFSEKRDFAAAATVCERLIVVNTVIIGICFSGLVVGGEGMLLWISGGKYGTGTLTILAMLLVVVALETHRLILEMLAQTVESYEVLIPSNILLAFSVLPGVLLYPFVGAVCFPLANAFALVLANRLVRRSLEQRGFRYAHPWRRSIQILLMGLTAIACGLAFEHFAGLHWLVTTALIEIVYLLFVWRYCWADIRLFISDFTRVRSQSTVEQN